MELHLYLNILLYELLFLLKYNNTNYYPDDLNNMLYKILLYICIALKLVDNYNHAYIPVFTDIENEIICIEEEI